MGAKLPHTQVSVVKGTKAGPADHLGQRLVLTFSGECSMSGRHSCEWPPDTHGTSDPEGLGFPHTEHLPGHRWVSYKLTQCYHASLGVIASPAGDASCKSSLSPVL